MIGQPGQTIRSSRKKISAHIEMKKKAKERRSRSRLQSRDSSHPGSAVPSCGEEPGPEPAKRRRARGPPVRRSRQKCIRESGQCFLKEPRILEIGAGQQPALRVFHHRAEGGVDDDPAAVEMNLRNDVLGVRSGLSRSRRRASSQSSGKDSGKRWWRCRKLPEAGGNSKCR